MQCSILVKEIYSLGRKVKRRKCMSDRHRTAPHSSEEEKGIGTEEKKRREEFMFGSVRHLW
jgi:hypothetical protein